MSSPLSLVPPEVILEIALYAQHQWHTDIMSPQAPHSAVRRLDAHLPQTTMREKPCCYNLEYSAVPECYDDSLPIVGRSPAHALSLTCRWMRSLVINFVSLWQTESILYRKNAEYSGKYLVYRQDAREPSVSYGSRTLVALQACSCFLKRLGTYCQLESIKVAIAREIPGVRASDAEEFFVRYNTIAPNTLRHFDLEILQHSRTADRIHIRAVRTSSLLSSRAINTSVVFFSSQLTSMYLFYSPSLRPRLGPRFFVALLACSEQLLFLTIDAGSAVVHAMNTVTLPALRYFRLVAPIREGAFLLSHLRLPAQVDIHLEPVVEWRATVPTYDDDVEPPVLWSEVPFHLLDDEADTGNRRGAIWRYVNALAAPDKTSALFRDFHPTAFPAPENLWDTLTTVALDVRLDPSASSSERECERFPEAVGVYFTKDLHGMHTLLSDPGLDWAHSLPPTAKTTVRRSLIVRDGVYDSVIRDSLYRPQYLKPVYECIDFVLTAALQGGGRGLFYGTPSCRCLVLHEASFKPRFSMGWDSILSSFLGVERIVIRCQQINLDDTLRPSSEGCLEAAHLEALAIYLNDAAPPGRHPCIYLKEIHLTCHEPLPSNSQWLRLHRGNEFELRLKPALSLWISVKHTMTALDSLKILDACVDYGVGCFIKGMSLQLPVPEIDSPSGPEGIPQDFLAELRVVAHRVLEAVNHQIEIPLNARTYGACIAARAQDGRRPKFEAVLQQQFPMPRIEGQNRPCCFKAEEGEIVMWYLPNVLLPARQAIIAESIPTAAAAIAAHPPQPDDPDDPNMDSPQWRHSELFYAIDEGEERLRFGRGMATLSPGWFQQAQDGWNDTLQVSRDLGAAPGRRDSAAQISAQRWLAENIETGILVSVILAIVHPAQYRESRAALDFLATLPDFAHHMKNWTFVFNAVTLITNRLTPGHRDRASGGANFYDLLLTIGGDSRTVLSLPGLGIRVQYDSGAVALFSGNEHLHEVSSFGMERACVACYARPAVMRWLNAKHPPPPYGEAMLPHGWWPMLLQVPGVRNYLPKAGLRSASAFP
ncbi:unnamed protein product [Peniophora sp. CBMAI 1063]|nr:unnamed protein product [Peniophora sp. CBMAI 1063]